MDNSQLRTIEQIKRLFAASVEVAFAAYGDDLERYAYISRVLKRFEYHRCSKYDYGMPLRYLQHISGYIRAQVTRLVECYRASAAPFARQHTSLDIELPVEMDKAHQDVCARPTHLLGRAFFEYRNVRCERLVPLSCLHLYNRVGYGRLRVSLPKTHPARNSIGVRKAPRPDGRVGFVRIDSVYQGDEVNMREIHHITCVDSI